MNFYLIFKSLHLIAVISWMAGLLYLPRIFVYHSQYNDKPLVSDVFKVMEKKLFFYIMTPAMALSWIFGLLLIHEIGFGQLGHKWMILKLFFVVQYLNQDTMNATLNPQQYIYDNHLTYNQGIPYDLYH